MKELKDILSDITELIYYSKNTTTGNVSHKMPAIMCRLNEIEKNLEEIINDEDLFSKFNGSTLFPENQIEKFSEIEMQEFSKWSLNNLLYCYEPNLNKWFDRKTFKIKTWEEIFAIYNQINTLKNE